MENKSHLYVENIPFLHKEESNKLIKRQKQGRF